MYIKRYPAETSVELAVKQNRRTVERRAKEATKPTGRVAAGVRATAVDIYSNRMCISNAPAAEKERLAIMRSIPRFLSSSLSWAHAVSSVSVGRCCRAKHFGASFESEWPVKAQKHTHTHTHTHERASLWLYNCAWRAHLSRKLFDSLHAHVRTAFESI